MRMLAHLAVGCFFLFATIGFGFQPTCAAETEAADQAQPGKRIVFISGRPSHGYGQHEHHAGCLLLAKYLQQNMPGYQAEVFKYGWPQEGLAALQGADAVVVFCDGGRRHLLNPHLDEFDQLMRQGVGLACLHYGVEVPKGKPGDAFLRWIGGYFEARWSVNPHWKAEFKTFPDHPVARGIKPFAIYDEWYYHMRFREAMQGVTPVLSAHPPQETLRRPDGPHSGNPAVRKAIAEGKIQHLAWVAERPDGGRGFGFTGGHYHNNWGDDNFRRLVLNAIVWIAQGEVPEHGVPSETPLTTDLEANQDYSKPEK